MSFDNPGVCSTIAATDPPKQPFFQLAPNPLPAETPLRVWLDNGYFGTVKFELLNLAGQALRTFFREKTARQISEM